MVRRDSRFIQRGFFRLAILALLLTGLSGVKPVDAQAVGDGPMLQPTVALVFVADEESFSDPEQRATRLLFSAVEGAFRSQRRYRLSRIDTTSVPESAEGPAVFVAVAPRRDGRLGVETDIWNGSDFTTSEVFDLPTDRDRFSVADEVATAMTAGIEALFPGFGRVRFSNDGYANPYYVYVDGTYLGADIDEIELLIGTYEFEVRRRDDGFEQVVGRREVRLGDDDYVEIRFSLSQTPPPIPGFLRLTDPNERWSALFDIRGSYLIPLEGFEFFDPTFGAGVMASALFNDVGLAGFVLGATAGHLYTTGVDAEIGDIDYEINVTPAMGLLGLSVGPVSGVDFIVRAGGGMALTRYTETVTDAVGSESIQEFNDLFPAFEGVMEFGFGLWGDMRLSLHSSWFGVWDDDEAELFSWIGVGLGIGGRF